MSYSIILSNSVSSTVNHVATVDINVVGFIGVVGDAADMSIVTCIVLMTMVQKLLLRKVLNMFLKMLGMLLPFLASFGDMMRIIMIGQPRTCVGFPGSVVTFLYEALGCLPISHGPGILPDSTTQHL